MIFKELRLVDFLSFYGDNAVTFPDPEANKSALVLILAANNSGKTNLIRGLKFFLYGDLLNHDTTPERLINDLRRHQVSTGDEAQGWMQATLQEGERQVTLRRRVVARKRAADKFDSYEIVLEELSDAAGRRRTWVKDTGTHQRHLKHLVPEALFDYFYFKGEELANAVASHSSKVRVGLELLLHQKKWEMAQETIEDIRTGYASELRKLGQKNQEYTKAHDEYERDKKELHRRTTELEELKNQKRELDTEYDDNAAALHKMAAGKNIGHLLGQQAELSRKAQNADHRLNDVFSDVVHTVGASHGISFLKEAFAPGQRILAEMREANLLPADISAGLVERLLSANEPACICGRSLQAPEHEDARACLKSFATKALSVDVNASLLQLVNCLEGNVSGGFPARVADTAERLRMLINQHERLRHEQQQVSQKEVALVEELREFPQADFAGRLQRQNQLVDKRERLANQISQKTSEHRQVAQRVPALKEKIDRLRKGTAHQRIRQLAECEKIAERLSELIEESLRHLRRDFREVLQNSLTHYYDAVVTDGSTAYVDPRSLLPSIRIGGQVQHNVGGGQQQILVISYMVALADLRTRLHADLDRSGIRVGKVDDQSFFLDSIFSPTDNTYADKIASLLPQKARQMVIMVASQQWHDSVRNAITPHVDRIYQFILHSPAPEPNHVIWNGKTVSLVVESPQEKPYTLIKELPSCRP